MFSFYAPELEGPDRSKPLLSSFPFVLNKEESHHGVQVLRMVKGDKVQILNGKGYIFEAEILKADPKACHLQIDTFTFEERRPYSFHLVIAPTKNIDRMEWLLEKATEIGIDQITPILCQNSERRILNPERLEKVIVSAVKQSGQAYMPELNSLRSISDFIKLGPYPNAMVAHCRNTPKTVFSEAIKNGKTREFTILIGPEGDFTEIELDSLIKQDFIPISLGKSRLRTETAGLLVCAQLAVLNT